MPLFLDYCHITPIFPSLIQVRCTSLLLEDEYAFQYLINLLGTYKKQLRQEMEEANRKKLRGQLVAATKRQMHDFYLAVMDVFKRSS